MQRIIEILTPMECFGCSAEGPALCSACLNAATRPQQLSGVSVGSLYEGPVQELILALKFQRLRSAANAVAQLALAAPLPVGIDVITSVPISATRYRERGYNQSELIAKAMARQLNLPYRSMLGRVTSRHQLGLSRRERLEQIQGVFYVTHAPTGLNVLVVDDVVTTGATLAECRAQLRAAGAGEVHGLAAAYRA